MSVIKLSSTKTNTLVKFRVKDDEKTDDIHFQCAVNGIGSEERSGFAQQQLPKDTNYPQSICKVR